MICIKITYLDLNHTFSYIYIIPGCIDHIRFTHIRFNQPSDIKQSRPCVTILGHAPWQVNMLSRPLLRINCCRIVVLCLFELNLPWATNDLQSLLVTNCWWKKFCTSCDRKNTCQFNVILNDIYQIDWFVPFCPSNHHTPFSQSFSSWRTMWQSWWKKVVAPGSGKCIKPYKLVRYMI